MNMNYHQIDRRVAKTKAALEKALVSLILRKGYETTTVEDICAEANVGRSTFYGHFTSKDDLKRSGLIHLRKLLTASQPQHGGQSLGFSLAMFEHATQHIDLFHALSKGGGADLALGVIHDIVVDTVKSELANSKDGNSKSSIPLAVRVEFIVGAFMSILVWWLKNGAALSPKRIDQMFRQMIVNGSVEGNLLSEQKLKSELD